MSPVYISVVLLEHYAIGIIDKFLLILHKILKLI